MNKNVDLGKIEKKIYMAYNKDGLWDIGLGFAFLSLASIILVDKPAFAAIFFPIFVAVSLNFKKAFTLPRLGYAKFSPERQAKEQKAKTKMIVLFTFTFLSGLVAFWGYMGGSDFQQLIRDLELLPFGAVLALSVGVIGALMGVWRFITYGILIFAFFVAGYFLQAEPPAYMMILGMIFLIYGVFLMIRFMKKYPKPPKDEFKHDFQ